MKIAKRILSLCLVFILSIGCVAIAEDEGRLITVSVDGNKINFDVNPILDNGRTLVPMRFIFEALGAEVGWEDTTQTATAVKGDITISITINKPELIKNGNVITLDVPAKLVSGRTLVPVRAVSEGMEANVEWIDETSQVIITTKGNNKGSYLYSELSKNDKKKLASNASKRIKAFENEVLPASSIGNTALSAKILKKDTSVFDFVGNAWIENVVNEIRDIQKKSTDTYDFEVSASAPIDAVKKATEAYISIANQAGLGISDVVKSAEYVDMESGAVMLLTEYMRPESTEASYIGIVALGDGSIRYFTAIKSDSDSFRVYETLLDADSSKTQQKDLGIAVGKDAIIHSINLNL